MLGKSYLCDGKRPCRSSPNCYVNGGECMHTAHMGNSISKKYPEFAPTCFMLDEDENVVERIDTASIMRTFMADNPTSCWARMRSAAMAQERFAIVDRR